MAASALFDMLLLMAYRWAAELETRPARWPVYRERERQLRQTVQSLYWDDGAQAVRRHAVEEAVLAARQHAGGAGDVITGRRGPRVDAAHARRAGTRRARPVLQVLRPSSRWRRSARATRYLDRLGDWRDMLARGLTTFAETVDRPGAASRSDCHAWSASPNIEIFRTVLGVDSAAPGFRRVSVRPHLGKLRRAGRVRAASKGQRRGADRRQARYRRDCRRG